MSHLPHQTIPPTNNLWIARKRVGLPQKKVAAFLGVRSLSTVSEYEKGRKLPSLPIALRLELLYQTPLRDLFPNLYGEAGESLPSVKSSQSTA